MSFGFSVGDFIAAAEIATTVIKALSDSRGSESQHKSLIELLGSIDASLRAVAATLISSSVTSGLPLPDSRFLDGLRKEIESCQKLMKGFLVSDIQSCMHRMIEAHFYTSGKIKEIYRKLLLQ
jgi:hypothetical protein